MYLFLPLIKILFLISLKAESSPLAKGYGTYIIEYIYFIKGGNWDTQLPIITKYNFT